MMYLRWIMSATAGCILLLMAATLAIAVETTSLRLRDNVVIEGQVVRFEDLIEIVSGRSPQIEELLKKPIGPAPREGIKERWSRQSVIEHLQLLGLHPSAMRWTGPEQVEVRRGEPITTSGRLVNTSIGSANIPSRGGAVPAFVNERTLTQAENHLKQAITEYIALKSGDRTEWTMKLIVPPEFIQILQVKSNVVSITGGQDPWDGVQDFEFHIKDKGALVPLKIQATLELPPMIVTAKSPLRREEILTRDMLTYSPLKKGTTNASRDYFTNVDELVGKQLRQSVSSGMPIESQYVGSPIVITRGNLIEVESVSGGILVKTSGRASESGGVGDLISVEVLPHRKRILATIVEPLKVRVESAPNRTKDKS
jgi:flagella basal body P-ring formation protein FlgA